jgi:hypothetical protein
MLSGTVHPSRVFVGGHAIFWDRMFRKLALASIPALLAVAFVGAEPVHAKDPWKDAYKQQEKRAKAYQKYRRKQAKDEVKFCRKYGC